jgi:hypothetical protein
MIGFVNVKTGGILNRSCKRLNTTSCMFMGRRGITLHVLNLDTRRSQVISFILRSLQLQRKISVLIGMEVSGHKRHCGCCRRDRNIYSFLPETGVNSSIHRPVQQHQQYCEQFRSNQSPHTRTQALLPL